MHYLLIALLVAPLCYAQPIIRQLSLEAIDGSAEVPLDRREPVQALRLSPSGDAVYDLLYGRRVVRKYSFDIRGRVEEIPLAPIPGMAAEALRLLSDLDVTAGGMIHVPFTSREDGRFVAAVAVWDAQGAYQKVVRLDPPVNIRHFAVEETGNLFVLGTDPQYLQGQKDSNLLVHKYSSSGKRLASFSETSLPRPTGGQSPGAPVGKDFRDLMNEVDRGKLWIQDGLVHHSLPVSRELRVFARDGSLRQRVRLALPLGAPAGRPILWNVLGAGEGRIAVVWAFEENTDGRGRRLNLVAVHDFSGQPLTLLYGPRDMPQAPVVCDKSQTCVVLKGQRSGQPTVARARLTLR